MVSVTIQAIFTRIGMESSEHNGTYYMTESVFAMRLVNLRSVTCYTDQNF